MITLREREKKKNENDLIKLREKEKILEIFNQIEERKQNNRCDQEKMKTKKHKII